MADNSCMRPLRTASILVLAVLVLSWARPGLCSGIDVTNTSLGTLNGGTGTAPVNFDISWNWSWRHTDPGAPAPNNWDAAWVFVKFRKNGGNWTHATLSNTGHTAPSGAALDVGLADTGSSYNISTNPGVGVFVYRSADGAGAFSKSGFSLLWNFSQDGVATNDTVDIRVFAIEMVYVPTDNFFAGDRNIVAAQFQQGSSDTDPWRILSENAISVGNQAGTGTFAGQDEPEYYYKTDPYSDDDATGATFTIPAAFPKGYQKFYIMKGEISQGQWLAFFNTLTATQKSTRDTTSATGKNADTLSNRNNFSWTSGDATLPNQGGGATYEDVAMSYLSWADLSAYLDWSGLRPMSELEFEKAARGVENVVSGGYAWGSTSITSANAISNGGTSTEVPAAAANCVYNNKVGGPMRVGAMADGDSTRIASGAGYYGAMDLSGNLRERSVTVGNSTGRSFEGRYHGDGALDSNGNQNVSTWPGTNAVGSNIRGGNWADTSTFLEVSYRGFGGLAYTARGNGDGGRGVRSAP